MDVHICTIAARNYLPFVRTLARSLAETHPDRRLAALLVDDEDGAERGDGTFDIVRLSDLPLDLVEAHRMAAIYDITEFATALKPWLLEYLLDRGADAVLYLDPDIRVYGSLDPLAEAARDHGIALTPHCDVPLPLDDKKADDRTILGSGVYNLGFIGVGRSARPFLAYWQERLRRQCIMRPEQMRFVDQRWIDFVPGLFDHAIVRDPQYNVAYWNLHGRTVRLTGTGVEVNGRPLGFFHFSGYSPDRPHLLSKHQGENPRILLSEHPELARLCADYGRELVANGAGAGPVVPYGFGRMADGTPVDEAVRTLYRAWLHRAEDPDGPGADLPPDPFDPAEVACVIARLNDPPTDDFGDGNALSTYQSRLLHCRPDLRASFPDAHGADRNRFLAWMHDEVAEGRFPAALAVDHLAVERTKGSPQTVTELAGRWSPPDRLRAGIVVAGFLNAELGIGESARLTARAVEASGIPFTTVTYRATQSRQRHPFTAVGEDGGLDFDTNIVVVNADVIRHFASAAGSDFFAGRYTIGHWAWELDEFPARFAPAFDVLHEVWAISEFAREAIAMATDKPVLTLPYPVPVPEVRADLDRQALGLPEGYLFLFCFDLFSVLERKNPIGTIEAFRRAFAPGEGPTLVLKALNGAKRAADVERIRWAIGDRPDIVLLDRYLDHDENAALIAMADCYVSLHRSEGFGLTMAEAMAFGKPVIATGYSGNLTFMDEETAHLVPAELVSVPPGNDPYPVGSHWADPDLDEAARFMRRVVTHPEEARAMGARARTSVITHHSIDRFTAFVQHRFDEIQELRAAQIAAGRRSVAVRYGEGPGGRLALRQRVSGARTTVRRIIASGVAGQERQDTSASVASETTAALGTRDEVGDFALLEDRLKATERRFGRVAGRLERVERQIDAVGVDPDEYRLAVTTAAQLRSVPDTGDPPRFRYRDESGQEVIGYGPGDAAIAGYAGFEDVFRGPEDVIRKRMEAYLPLLEGRGPVLDLGSGRGEMLDLLAEHGIAAEGIDLDASMVARSRAKGHTVSEGDALTLLQERTSGSVGSVVSIQVIEHLQFDVLVDLLAEIRRVLVPGGITILETVNPHAVQAFKAFWTDPTHVRPIFPEVLVLYCREAGFDAARVVFPGGTGRLADDRWRCGDYAVVATTA